MLIKINNNSAQLFPGNKHKISEIPLYNNNLIMSNNQYMNINAYNNPLQTTQNLNKNLLSNLYRDYLNINNFLNYNSVNRNVCNNINNLNSIPNSFNNPNAFNHEIINTHINNFNNSSLISNESLINADFQVNCAMPQIPNIANNCNFNSINKEQEKLNIDSFNFNKFNDSVKFNYNNSSNNFNQFDLLGNSLNHGLENLRFSVNMKNINNNTNNLKNDFSNSMNFLNQNKIRNMNQPNNQNYSGNFLKHFPYLKTFQNNSQEIINEKITNSRINENFGNENKPFNVIYPQIKTQNIDFSSHTNHSNHINNSNLNHFSFAKKINNIKENVNIQVNNAAPNLVDLIKELNNNFSNNTIRDQESCDTNKVLNCYLFLKKYNLINNINEDIETKEILDSIEAYYLNLTKNQSPSENNNKGINNNNISNNNNNYNYILNNYNLNITPNEGKNILKNITTMVFEKEIHAAANTHNQDEETNSKNKTTAITKNEKHKLNQRKTSKKENASKVLNTVFYTKIAAEAEKNKALSEKLKSELSVDMIDPKKEENADNKEKKIKLFGKKLFRLEKIPTNIRIEIKSKSENSSNSLNSYSKCHKRKIFQSKKLPFTSKVTTGVKEEKYKETEKNKDKDKVKEREKENKVSTRRSSNLIRIEKEEQIKEFNCYNEFYFEGSERNDIIKKELEEYSQYYEEDLVETLKDEKHAFMNSHFPEMYLKKDNFYFNIKMLNKKRKTEALLNSAYQRSRHYLKQNNNNAEFCFLNAAQENKSLFASPAAENKFSSSCNNNKSHKRIGDFYDIFFNLVNEKNYGEKKEINLITPDADEEKDYFSYKGNIKDVCSSEEKNSEGRNTINSIFEIEINLNLNPDRSESNISPEKANYRRKSFDIDKLYEETNKYLNNPSYTAYTNSQGMKLINSIDFIDLKNNKNTMQQDRWLKENIHAQNEFDIKNLNSLNAVMNKIWDDKVIVYDKGN